MYGIFTYIWFIFLENVGKKNLEIEFLGMQLYANTIDSLSLYLYMHSYVIESV